MMDFLLIYGAIALNIKPIFITIFYIHLQMNKINIYGLIVELEYMIYTSGVFISTSLLITILEYSLTLLSDISWEYPLLPK